MAKKSALVLEAHGQISQMVDGDFLNIGKLNVGPEIVINVTTTSISVSGTNNRLTASSSQNLGIINGGEAGDIAIFRGSSGMSTIKIWKNLGNIYGGINRTFDGPKDVMVLLNVAGVAWLELLWNE